MSDLRYPVGRFAALERSTPEQRRGWIDEIRRVPAELRRALEGLDESRLDTPYREGGWTIRQLVHHLANSHVNAYVRFRLALTEESPTIRPYDQESWARLPDASGGPVELSASLLEALHGRWVLLLESLGPEDFSRPVLHPESGRMTVDLLLQTYAWHGRHHVAHVTALREREGWR